MRQSVVSFSCAFVLVITTLSSYAASTCGGNRHAPDLDSSGESSYKSAIKILIALNDGEFRRPADQVVKEMELLALLDHASQKSCAKAKVEPAQIRLLQAATVESCRKSTSNACAESNPGAETRTAQYEAEAFKLLTESAAQGEGYFELGLMMLTSSSAWYSPDKGRGFIVRAKESGDQRALDFLNDTREPR